MRWSGGGASIRLLAVRGVGAADPQSYSPGQGLTSTCPRPPRKRSGGSPDTGPSWQARPDGDACALWLEKPGLGYILLVSQALESELDRIVDGLVPTEPPPSPREPVDHVGFAHLPPAFGEPRTARGSAPAGARRPPLVGRQARGRGHRGPRRSPAHQPVGERVPARGEASTLPTGRAARGITTTGGDGRRGAFWETPEAAVHVKVSPDLADELDKIVEGIRNPGHQ